MYYVCPRYHLINSDAIMSDSNAQTRQKLFPNKSAFLLFWSYISLFVSQGLLVTAVQRKQIPGFNAAVVVLLTELVKLVVCIIVYLVREHSGGLAALLYDIKLNRNLLFLYLVPAFLYCLYNNLTFINLELFDVATYYCLMQFRIVLTGVIYQILFRRKLNQIQWISLFILTAGCLVKEYGLYRDISQNNNPNTMEPTRNIDSVANVTSRIQGRDFNVGREASEVTAILRFFWSTLLLIFQMFCSCFAGVYNEYLLKDSSTARSADVILQNIFMYFNSIICNIVIFFFKPAFMDMGRGHSSTNDKITTNHLPLSIIVINLLANPLVVTLILNNALSGLVASFFLKSLNSILKTFASALELFVITLLAAVLFGNKIDIYTSLALVLVTIAIFIYSKNPVSVAPPSKESQQNRDGFVLVPTSEE